MKTSFQGLLDAANAAIETITVEEAMALHGDADTVFVDLRDIRELKASGSIDGAEHCPRGMLEFWFHPDSPYFKPVFGQDKRYVLFCALGLRSALATKTLQDMGLDDVVHIEGGFTAWREAGGALAQLPPEK